MVEIGVVGTGAGTIAPEMIAESVKTEVYSILANIISLVKVTMMYIYNWMTRFWGWFSENPTAGVMLMANLYIMME